MEIRLEELDSIAFGQNVLKINDIDENIDFSQFELNYIEKYNPKYVYTKIDIEDISKIHYLEQNGFEYIETQLQLFKRLTELYDTTAYDGIIKLETVQENDLQEINKISDVVFDIDRIFIDEKINNSIAQTRYHLYLKNSLEKENQRFDKLIDISTCKIIAFHTLMYKDEKSVLLLLGGILPEYHSTGANYALDYYVYNELYKSGHKNITTHVSARNIKVMNYLIKVLGFKFKKSFVVLRKVY